MIPADLKKLRELCENATPGPWTCTNEDWPEILSSEKEIADLGNHYGMHTRKNVDEDAAFIAASREAIPRLLDEVERLQNQLKQVEPALKAGLDKVQLYEELTTKACKEANELRNERDSLKSEVERLHDKYDYQRLVKDNDSLKSEVEIIRTKWRACADAIGDVNARAFHLERERDLARTQLEKANARIGKLKKALERLRDDDSIFSNGCDCDEIAMAALAADEKESGE